MKKLLILSLLASSTLLYMQKVFSFDFNRLIEDLKALPDNDDAPIYQTYNPLYEILQLTDKKIDEIPPDFFEKLAPIVPKLKVLDLSDNELKKLPSTIGLLKNLRSLGLMRNQLTELPKEIGKLTKLKGLDLRHNQLTKLPKEIKNLEKLQILWLDPKVKTKYPDIIKVLQERGVSIYESKKN